MYDEWNEGDTEETPREAHASYRNLYRRAMDGDRKAQRMLAYLEGKPEEPDESPE